MKILFALTLLLAGAGQVAMAQRARPVVPGAPPVYYPAPTQMLITGRIFNVGKTGTTVLPHATVTVKRPNGSVAATMTADDSGDYRLLIPGDVLATLPDSISVTASAFMFESQTIKARKAKAVGVIFYLHLLAMHTESAHINVPPIQPSTTGAEQAFWPPPQCSTLKVLDPQYFVKAHTLAQVDAILSKALTEATYDDLRYYYAPGGFVLITRIEQTDANGIALPGKARWSVNIPDGFGSSFASYLKALLIPPSGHFRVIAFAVTNAPINRYRAAPSQDEALKWLQQGADALSPKVGALPYDATYHCTALIYEFQRSASSTGGLVVPAQLSAREHLDNSRIARYLPRIQP